MMTSINDEKLVLHVRERFVVFDLLERVLLRLRGQPLDCVCPGFERRGIEGIRGRRHQLWRKGPNGLWTECKDHGCPVTLWKEKAHRRFTGQGGVVVCMLNTTRFICHASCMNVVK